MFKPFKGKCSCHNEERWILNRKGECNVTIIGRKKEKVIRGNNGGFNNKRKLEKPINNKRTTRRNLGRNISGQNNRSQDKRLELLHVPKKKAKKKIQHRRKCTGELALYEKIIQVRGPFSQISGKELIGFDVRWFSHILTKGAYPRFRLKEENILLKTPDEHFKWEFEAHKLRNLPEWKWVFELKEKLKQEYYAK